MDIDISVLRLMEREKDLPFEVLASAIEDALLTAYEKTEGAVHGASSEGIGHHSIRPYGTFRAGPDGPPQSTAVLF